MKFKISHSMNSAVRKIALLDKVMQEASAETLRSVAMQTARQGARELRDLKYAPRLKISDILGGSAKVKISKMTQTPNNAQIWVSPGPKNSTPISLQSSAVNLSTKRPKLLWFNPANKTVKTRKGERHGVVVTIFGKRFLTGGFHVKGGGKHMVHGSPGGVGKFDAHSRIMIRQADGSLRMFKTISIVRALDNAGKLEWLEQWGRKRFGEIFGRNFDRYSRKLFRSELL